MKTIVVTGGAGFIGSHLCERLVKEGNKVISLDNYYAGSRDNHVPGVIYREGHTKDIETLVPESPDIVFHLGEYSRVEQSFEDMEAVWDLNKTGTFAVLEFVRRRGAKLVYAGSSTKFGDGGLGRDQSPYAWAKATNTELVKNYSSWFGINYAITYFYNVYGPRERAGSMGTVIEIFRQNKIHGRPMTVVAPGTQKRNFTNVYDIVDGLVLVGEKGEGDDFGIGAEESYSVLEVAEMFKSEILMMPERQGNRTTSEVDTTRIRELGWKQSHKLTEYIQNIVAEVGEVQAHENRILVFTTTFYPDAGPAEEALCTLMQQMPDVQFDVITAAYTKHAEGVDCPAPNATIHRVGFGNAFDKYLLPFLGARKGSQLVRVNTYLFAWSLMASYGALAALGVRRSGNLPLLVTLADQRLGWQQRILLRFLMERADQIYASTSVQSKKLGSLESRMRAHSSMGAGDALANAVRFAYSTILRKQ